jgi:hypothetical protein
VDDFPVGRYSLDQVLDTKSRTHRRAAKKLYNDNTEAVNSLVCMENNSLCSEYLSRPWKLIGSNIAAGLLEEKQRNLLSLDI